MAKLRSALVPQTNSRCWAGVRLVAAFACLGFVQLAAPGEAVAQRASARSKSSAMASQWEALYPTEARISILGLDPVEERRVRFDADKQVYSEAMRLPGGNMLFEWRKGASAQEGGSAEAEITKRYGALPQLQSMGIKVDAGAVRQIASENGALAVASVQSNSHRCVFFFQYGKQGDGKGEQSQALTGGLCLQANARGVATMEADVLDMLTRVRFDNGAYARSQMFAAGLNQARQRAKLDAAALARDTLPPSLEVVERLTTPQAEMTIQGVATDDTEVTEVRVNGRWANIAPDGNFAMTIQVPAGASRVTVMAVDVTGKRTERVVTVVNSGLGPQKAAVFQPAAMGKYHALVIANQTYLDPQLNLDTTVNDGRAVAQILERRYGFKVHLLVDARKADILRTFEQLAQELTPADNLLIYYAGHGVVDEQAADQPGYWVPTDGTGADSSNWLPNKDVIRAIRAINARHLMIVSDSCFSGTLTQEHNMMGRREVTNMREAIPLRSRTALSSGGIEQVVDVFKPGDQNSVFALNFVDVLNRNPGAMSGIQISNLVRGLVRRQVQQTPQYGAVLSAGHDDGSDFFFRAM